MNSNSCRQKASSKRRITRGFTAPLSDRRSPRAAILCAAALMFCAATLAAPAPWYLWRSKLTGELYCAQTPPGQGWALSDGPFKDLACQQPGRPGR